MNTPQNQRHAETERRLREALLHFIEADQEPTIGQLCEQAKINRSTFYRHYVDVYDLMVHVEQEFQSGLLLTLRENETLPLSFGTGPEMLEPLISYVGQNPHFYQIYLRSSANFPLEGEFQRLWTQRISPMFKAYGVEQESHMRYYYEYIRNGIIVVLKLWLDHGCTESPGEIAQILFRMLPIRPDSANTQNAKNNLMKIKENER